MNHSSSHGVTNTLGNSLKPMTDSELYQAQGKYVEAEPLYKRALAIFEKALGPEHSDVAAILENYAVLLRQTGRSAEANEMEARAKAIRAKHAGENPAN